MSCNFTDVDGVWCFFHTSNLGHLGMAAFRVITGHNMFNGGFSFLSSCSRLKI
jgi:hypothetical protein